MTDQKALQIYVEEQKHITSLLVKASETYADNLTLARLYRDAATSGDAAITTKFSLEESLHMLRFQLRELYTKQLDTLSVSAPIAEFTFMYDRCEYIQAQRTVNNKGCLINLLTFTQVPVRETQVYKAISQNMFRLTYIPSGESAHIRLDVLGIAEGEGDEEILGYVKLPPSIIYYRKSTRIH